MHRSSVTNHVPSLTIIVPLLRTQKLRRFKSRLQKRGRPEFRCAQPGTPLGFSMTTYPIKRNIGFLFCQISASTSSSRFVLPTRSTARAPRCAPLRHQGFVYYRTTTADSFTGRLFPKAQWLRHFNHDEHCGGGRMFPAGSPHSIVTRVRNPCRSLRKTGPLVPFRAVGRHAAFFHVAHLAFAASALSVTPCTPRV
jgi:hypothetical protein